MKLYQICTISLLVLSQTVAYGQSVAEEGLNYCSPEKRLRNYIMHSEHSQDLTRAFAFAGNMKLPKSISKVDIALFCSQDFNRMRESYLHLNKEDALLGNAGSPALEAAALDLSQISALQSRCEDLSIADKRKARVNIVALAGAINFASLMSLKAEIIHSVNSLALRNLKVSCESVSKSSFARDLSCLHPYLEKSGECERYSISENDLGLIRWSSESVSVENAQGFKSDEVDFKSFYVAHDVKPSEGFALVFQSKKPIEYGLFYHFSDYFPSFGDSSAHTNSEWISGNAVDEDSVKRLKFLRTQFPRRIQAFSPIKIYLQDKIDQKIKETKLDFDRYLETLPGILNKREYSAEVFSSFSLIISDDHSTDLLSLEDVKISIVDLPTNVALEKVRDQYSGGGIRFSRLSGFNSSFDEDPTLGRLQNVMNQLFDQYLKKIKAAASFRNDQNAF